MMETQSYKKLGGCVHPIDVRNKSLDVVGPMGINIEKYFMPSVANIIDTDLSNYKIVGKNQFACNLMHVGRDERLPISLHSGDTKIIVSPAYFVFEINPDVQLLPEFLMLWFRRPEFDRNAWFYTDGDVRGGLEKESLFNMEIPVPDIAVQRKIVAEYQAVEARIAANERMISKLEETAQAIYKKMFIDDIDPAHLPAGWRTGSITELAKLKAGGDKPLFFSKTPTSTCTIPVYANSAENEGVFGYTNKSAVSDRSVTITARGTVGQCFLRNTPFFPIVRLVVITPLNSQHAEYLYYYYSALNLEGDGSVQSQLTVPQLAQQNIIIPPSTLMIQFDNALSPIDKYADTIKKENFILNELKGVLLSKMSE